MSERFTDRARKVMQLANREAQRFHHEYLGTEHILLGLVQEGSGVAAQVLKNMRVDLQQIRKDVEKIVRSGPQMSTLAELPQTPRAKHVIEYAMQEARNLDLNYVGTEHLLLGLLRPSDGVAGHVLLNLNLKLEDVRAEVMHVLGLIPPTRSLESAGASQIDGSTVSAGRSLSAVWVWLGMFALLLALFFATGDLLWLALEPYLAIAWSPLQTAFWLRRNDPWPMRGKVTFHFHVAMAIFRASFLGWLIILLCMVLFHGNGRPPTEFIVAVCLILVGSVVACLLGCWGTFLAFRSGVRVFVISNLKSICSGDFSRISHLPAYRFLHNPASYIISIAFIVPLIILWFVALMQTMGDPLKRNEQATLGLVVLSVGPFVLLGCVLFLLSLCRRIIARTPQDCWGVMPTPVEEH